jgi:prepilin peptidase CpaA
MAETLAASVPWLAAGLLAFAAAADIALRIIPDTVPLSLAILGLLSRLMAGDLALSLASALAVFILAAFAWRRGWLGGGDVKLLAACALLVSPASVPILVEYTALSGGGLATLYLAARRLPRLAAASHATGWPVLLRRVWRIERWRALRGSLPYGCAIAAGALIVLFGG